jgi:hypothetical protein
MNGAGGRTMLGMGLRRHDIGIALTCLWVLAVGASVVRYRAYASAPGSIHEVPAMLPAHTSVGRRGQAAVIMFVHPDCPCTRASLTELEEAVRGRPPAQLVLVLSHDDSSVRDRVARIPGATVFVDAAGTEAERFGARTSGFTVMYDAAGVLRFSGGITGSRGHVGNNAGRMALQSLLANATTTIDRHAVFGCGIEKP